MTASMTWTGPDFKGRVAAKVHQEAIDAGLKNHRRKFLPRHFMATSPARYPEAYRSRKSSSKYERGKAYGEKLAKMTESERRQHGKDIRDSRKGKSMDPKGNIPLVDKGALRTSVLQGAVTFIGAPWRRRMEWSAPPFYTFFNPPEKIDKVKAIEAIRPDENEAFMRVVEARYQKYLDTKKKKKK